MTCVYDKEVFAKFRALAVTNEADFVPGKMYYSNTAPSQFIYVGPSEDKPGWFMAVTHNEWAGLNVQPHSLADRNIGASYNPWLIFESKDARDLCSEFLTVSFERDDWMDEMFSFFDYSDLEEESEPSLNLIFIRME